MASVSHLFNKTQSGVPVQSVNKLVVDEQGIVGSVHRGKNNPRQLLIASSETVSSYACEPGSFKENIATIDFDVDSLKSGSVLQIGNDVKLRITFDCEPCGYMKSIGVEDLVEVTGKRGKLAMVVQPGEIVLGDEIAVLEEKYREVPSKFAERFYWLVKQIPQGKVLTYKDIAILTGTANGYIRAMPGLIKRRVDSDLPFHRILDSSNNLIEQYVPSQKQKLEAENVNLATIDLHRWSGGGLYL